MNRLVADLKERAGRLDRPVRFMEVCGTHTMVAFRSGIRALLPEGVSLISGPGCPVCVTQAGYIDAAVEIGRLPGMVITTFGDLIRVPGSRSSLEEERAKGMQVRVVYSPSDALELARSEPSRNVLFLAVGFETTVPTVALTVQAAREDGVGNFMVLTAHKTMPRAMEALLEGGEVQIDGFLCPGHVSVVAGAGIFSFLADRYRTPCVVAGFEPEDILEAIIMLLAQKEEGRSALEIGYRRAVTMEGNRAAQRIMNEVFMECDSEWRGLGLIPGSGLMLRDDYASFDAARRLGIEVGLGSSAGGCRCGDVLRGSITPPECALFGRSCTPARPLGPCMVSSEGTCAAYARYTGSRGGGRPA
ncbi:MAG: hydrogenase formation protein HypD [Actinobacteria bacterium RBG_16_64_13]|nr:MAG: hydrogenase formation protein HypD [Actinobacteria bacterium RBG_16_64_13]